MPGSWQLAQGGELTSGGTMDKQRGGYFSCVVASSFALLLGCQPAELIEAGDGTVSGSAPAVSVRNGQALASWHRGAGQVHVSAYHGSGWSVPLTIGTGRFPDIAVSNGDAAVALFANGSVLQVAERATSGWLPAHALDTVTALSYGVTIEGGGRASAVWSGSGQVKASIQEGSGWGGATVLGDHASFGNPQIATNDSGVLFAAWCGPSNRIWAARRVSPGSWEPRVSSSTNCCQGPALDTPGPGVGLGVSATGVAVIVGSTAARVCELRYKPGSGWQSTGVLGTPGADATTPSVAVNADGHALVAWNNFTAGGGLIQVRVYDPLAATWGPLLTGPATGTGRLGVGLGSTGYGAVVYRGAGSIRYLTYSAGALSAPGVVASAADTLYYLKLGFDPNVEAQGVSIWQRTGVGAENIWAARLGL
ncbi:MAG TPA: hypothetical protein VGJ91_03785 [Polyangiaceae bacterium]